jgi:hypothetical protein
MTALLPCFTAFVAFLCCAALASTDAPSARAVPVRVRRTPGR